jgi:hypothetical protein
MIDGHNSLLRDWIFTHELKCVLIELLKGYLAFSNIESKIHQLSNNGG